MLGLGGDPADGFGDVGRGEVELVGVHGRRLVLVALEADEGEVRLDAARVDLGDADGIADVLEAQHAGERPFAELGGVVAGAAGVRGERRHGADVNDVAFGGDELVQQGLDHPGGAEDVDVVHPLPVVEVGVLDGIHAHGAAGVVDQQVDALDPGSELVDGFLVRHVQLNGGAADLVGDGLNFVGAAGGGDDVPTLLGKCPRGGLADAGRGARYNCDLFIGGDAHTVHCALGHRLLH